MGVSGAAAASGRAAAHAAAASGRAAARAVAHAAAHAAAHATPAKTYLCIDLKSFYASVECAARGLDPFEANLVVADPERGPGTICLAVTPALKALGVRNRCRVFEIPPGIDYLMAPPRMRLYLEESRRINDIYRRFVSPDDMHVYSVDECFIDATPYLRLYRMDARSFAKALMEAVFEETSIHATAGIGPNLFLAKVALDVLAKHAPDYVGELNERSFRERMWFHRPLTDVWGIGPGTARRLRRLGVFELAGVCALPEKVLYREFGKNAEFLIDHAWGQEPCTIADIHAYTPRAHSLSQGQVLPRDYRFDEARVALREMVDAQVLELVEKKLVCRTVSLHVGYSWNGTANVNGAANGGGMNFAPPGEKAGRAVWRGTGGERTLPAATDLESQIAHAALCIYDQTTARGVPIRRLSLALGGVVPARCAAPTLFDSTGADEREHRLQEAAVDVRRRFGKNALLRGTSYLDAATARERNQQIGGHKA